MKAQITEAHRDLVLRVRVCDMHYGIEPAAQLIADSEARALDAALEQWAKATPSLVHFKAITAERDQLRAEVARLHEVNEDFDKSVAEVADFKANGCSIKESVRLRAEVERLAKIIGINKTDTDHIITSQRENLVALRNELAKERENVRVLRNACDEIMQLDVKWPRWEQSCLYNASVTLATDALVETNK